MGGKCKISFYCFTALFVVSISILAQVLIVGLFFVLPYFQNCDQTAYTSPLESFRCPTNTSQAYTELILPSTCSAISPRQIQYCYDTGCNAMKTSCPGERCCCRSVPQVARVNCSRQGTMDVSYNSTCVYAVCEKSLHSVLLQIYSSNVNNSKKVVVPRLTVQFGSVTGMTNSSGRIYLDGIEEGDYPISILAKDLNVSREYFHASTLRIGFYSPSEVVYIVYVKNITSTNDPQISGCNIMGSNPDIQTTSFSNSLNDLVTLPNNYLYNESFFFIPTILAFTHTSTETFIVSCDDNYTLFEYRGGKWYMNSTQQSSFTIESGLLWSLSRNIAPKAYTLFINPGTSPLILDRGSVLILTDNSVWFASRVTTHNRTVLSIPVISSTDIRIRYTTSYFSLLRQTKPVVELGSKTTTKLNDTCTIIAENLRNINDPTTATLSVMNTPTTSTCYYPLNSTGSTNSKIFSLTVTRGNSTVFMSAMKTNANSACLPYPCVDNNYRCAYTVGMSATKTFTCGQSSATSSAIRLLQCNNNLIP